MTAIPALLGDLESLSGMAAHAAAGGDWTAVERYETVRIAILKTLSGLAADPALRAEALGALRKADSHSVTIGHAIDVGRRAHERSTRALRQSGTARRLYGKARTA
ncbi:hypothetical protein [Sphingosinicella soli]|uniref:Flagellar protein FliT n=1 Tax=Sphingosinicella soli TaxID=333708 RepID=A0A7W7B2M4_9SPHN|nr:hypothetical protein [Sphingosinicella soli]MBB4632806.1 hypothetical protein [Sphingosinicella soli]